MTTPRSSDRQHEYLGHYQGANRAGFATIDVPSTRGTSTEELYAQPRKAKQTRVESLDVVDKHVLRQELRGEVAHGASQTGEVTVRKYMGNDPVAWRGRYLGSNRDSEGRIHLVHEVCSYATLYVTCTLYTHIHTLYNIPIQGVCFLQSSSESKKCLRVSLQVLRDQTWRVDRRQRLD